MITESQAEIVIKTLLCHPTPAILEEPEIKNAKKKIKKRYRDIRNAIRREGNTCFTKAEMQAKKEWLMEFLSEDKSSNPS